MGIWECLLVGHGRANAYSLGFYELNLSCWKPHDLLIFVPGRFAGLLVLLLWSVALPFPQCFGSASPLLQQMTCRDTQLLSKAAAAQQLLLCMLLPVM